MRTTLSPLILGGLFVVAAVGVLAANWQSLDSLGIALTLALLCVDQRRMALVDLNNIRQVTLADERVRQFHRITLITISLELIGFLLGLASAGCGHCHSVDKSTILQHYG